jgi:hypothetical protein
VCDVTHLLSGVSFSGVAMAIGVGAVGDDEVVVVVREVAMHCTLCTISSSPSYQVTRERTTFCRHAAPLLGVTPDACK